VAVVAELLYENVDLESALEAAVEIIADVNHPQGSDLLRDVVESSVAEQRAQVAAAAADEASAAINAESAGVKYDTATVGNSIDPTLTTLFRTFYDKLQVAVDSHHRYKPQSN
jgi:hypothetical protein